MPKKMRLPQIARKTSERVGHSSYAPKGKNDKPRKPDLRLLSSTAMKREFSLAYQRKKAEGLVHHNAFRVVMNSTKLRKGSPADNTARIARLLADAEHQNKTMGLRNKRKQSKAA